LKPSKAGAGNPGFTYALLARVYPGIQLADIDERQADVLIQEIPEVLKVFSAYNIRV
jgi:hypothetical protein